MGKSQQPSIFIDGEAGTTGLEIRERLARMRLADAEAERRERESAIEALIRGGDEPSSETPPPLGSSS